MTSSQYREFKTIGFWKSLENPNFPMPQSGIWNDAERKKLIHYIDVCPVAKVHGKRHVCLMCKQETGGLERTDGTFIWPSALVHYVKDHHVMLPDYFIEHVRRRDYKYPQEFASMFEYLIRYDHSMWSENEAHSAVA